MEQAKQADEQAIFLASVFDGLWFPLRDFVLCHLMASALQKWPTEKISHKFNTIHES